MDLQHLERIEDTFKYVESLISTLTEMKDSWSKADQKTRFKLWNKTMGEKNKLTENLKEGKRSLNILLRDERTEKNITDFEPDNGA